MDRGIFVVNNQTNLKIMQRKWSHESVKGLIAEYQGEFDNNPIAIIREKAKELVLKAYNFGWSGPPFDPIELARLLNIDVSPNESISDARIIPLKGNKLKIEYNPFQRHTRINFSIAHEIGHTLFPDCSNQIRNREENKEPHLWELEFLCDVAASEILLPYAEFVNEANLLPLNLESLLSVANKYNASLESVFLRFTEVVDKPCTIVIASFEDEQQLKLVVDYCKSSRVATLDIKDNYVIPCNSKAYECLNSGWTSYNIESWDVFGNTRYTVYSIGLPPLKQQKRQRVGLLIVPEHYDNRPEGKIYTVNGDATQPRGEGIKIIVQIINTSGGLGFGFGRAMSSRWPESKRTVMQWKGNEKEFILGESKLTKLDNDIYVFQIVAQEGIHPKNGIIPLKYDRLRDGLRKLSSIALELNASVHMPQIGAGQGKGDWKIIEGIIYDELSRKGISVSVYILPGTKYNSKNNSPLTLFDENHSYEE